MPLEALLRDRVKMMKLFWLGLIASLVFIIIGVIIMLVDLTK